ncbi:hypothetical protein B0H16DRAFT_1449143 [Mycena metata]|uniref:Uncharacterized protein n=1 Tax=Mycena metata TaxID=1033252 RepID=A0AAD7NWX8_9AGAR|nr:hypothetical protein B0H16DRAFT_1449143 [Mycena metata]
MTEEHRVRTDKLVEREDKEDLGRIDGLHHRRWLARSDIGCRSAGTALFKFRQGRSFVYLMRDSDEPSSAGHALFGLLPSSARGCRPRPWTRFNGYRATGSNRGRPLKHGRDGRETVATQILLFRQYY